MRFARCVVIATALLGSVGVAQAQPAAFYNVPFHHVEVKATSKIYVDYRFSPHRQTLVCSADRENSAITSVEWSYKDATRKLGLPVTLKDDSQFDGYFADPEGRLVVTNEFGRVGDASDSIFVSCEYRDIK